MENENIRILYMEDNLGHATLLRRRMRRFGYNVELASDGLEGLEKATACPFDIVITDQDMPGLGGMEVLRRLCEEPTCSASLIMLTGAGDEETVVSAMRCGAEDYVVKDPDGNYFELLPTIIQKIIEKRHLAQENKRVQEALRLSEEKFRSMFEFAPFGMVLCDLQGTILQANPHFCALFGEEVSWRDGPIMVMELLPALKEHPDFLRWLAEGEEMPPTEMDLVQSSGELLPVQAQAFLGESDTEIKRFWLFVENYKVRKELQERLNQASRLEAIGELAANIAHEINNPLGIISAKSRLLLSMERASMSDKVERELEKIVDYCDRLSHLTRGLLDYARPSLGTKMLVDLQQPLRKALRIIEHRATEENIEMELHSKEALTLVWANGQELEQVFLNLFLNALDAMESGGVLQVQIEHQTASAQQEVLVSIHDDGHGIPYEIQHRIFEPFFSTKEVGKGTGLGLSVCFGLIHGHQGHLEVQSTPGKGTTFFITLPLHKKADSCESEE